MTKKSREELLEEKETIERQLTYYTNQVKMLTRQEKEFDRRQRSHRLIERGAILEKYLQKPLLLTNDQIVRFLDYVFSLTATKWALEAFLEEAERKAINDKGEDDAA